MKGTTPDPHGGRSELSADLLRGYLARLRSLLGSAFDKLQLAEQRGRSSSTPPERRHSLMAVVQLIEAAVRSFATDASPVVDARAAAELKLLFSFLDRWRAHPLWHKLVTALENEYEHTIATLGTASFLEDMGNRVELQENSTKRGADVLLLAADGHEFAAVEVKTPRPLRWPSEELSQSQADAIVERAMKKAQTGHKGQLARRKPGMLVIVGFHLSASDLQRLETAARAYLANASVARRHAHIIGIAVLSMGAEEQAVVQGRAITARRLAGTLQVRLARNPGYRGLIRLSNQPTQALHPDLTKVEKVFGHLELAPTDEQITTSCPTCGTAQSLSECGIRRDGGDTVYVCRKGCQALVVVSGPEDSAWPGRGYRLGDRVIRNASDLLVAVPGGDAPVILPGGPDALVKMKPGSDSAAP